MVKNMNCPVCGSSKVTSQAITINTTRSKVKGFGCIKACLGYLLFSIPGILCGLCGMGKERSTTTSKVKVIHICQNCGNQF